MHKIALNGFGKIGQIIFTENYNKINSYNKSLVSVHLHKIYDNKSLIKSYKSVIRKYYPEKDIIIKT